MTIHGIYWHVHHSQCLIGYCYDLDERQEYNRNWGRHWEIGTRLKWLTPVKGELPAEFATLGKAVAEAHTAVLDATDPSVLRRAKEIREERCHEFRLLAYRHRAMLEVLHNKEHPDCPWNGERLVFPIPETEAI